MLQTINLVYVTLDLYHKLLQNDNEITVSKNSNKKKVRLVLDKQIYKT